VTGHVVNTAPVSVEDIPVRVRGLRERGSTPKEIARVVGLRPAEVTRLLRAIAAEDAGGERAVAGCWISPGWSAGLTIEGHPGWPRDDSVDDPEHGPRGLAVVLVARDDGRKRVSVCGYLVDVFCLGVKNVVDPRVMDAGKLPDFVRSYFAAFEKPPVEAPIELAQHLVFGAVDYARTFGFEPAPGFSAASDHLGEWTGPSAITFGLDGKPHFIQGPHDDSAKILKTLRRSAGDGNFDFTVVA
jgi:hypothetical protein